MATVVLGGQGITLVKDSIEALVYSLDCINKKLNDILEEILDDD